MASSEILSKVLNNASQEVAEYEKRKSWFIDAYNVNDAYNQLQAILAKFMPPATFQRRKTQLIGEYMKNKKNGKFREALSSLIQTLKTSYLDKAIVEIGLLYQDQAAKADKLKQFFPLNAQYDLRFYDCYYRKQSSVAERFAKELASSNASRNGVNLHKALILFLMVYTLTM